MKSNPITIRILQKIDLPYVEKIITKYWKEEDFSKKLINKIYQCTEGDPILIQQNFVCFVAEQENKVVGLICFRTIPDHMKEFTSTSKPCELYLLAVDQLGNGAGRALVEHAIQHSKNAGYTEIVLYSGETHQESWGFYDHTGFTRIADTLAPNGEPGKIWRLSL